MKGFTLIELIVVLLILSMTAALVVPRLPATDSMELKSSARSLASMLRYLGERSVGSKNIYRLHLNISENSLRVTRKLANGDEIPPDDPLLSRKVLAAGIVIADLQTPRLGKVTEGEVLIAGRRRRIAGVVTMDQMMIDCGQEEIAIGAEAVLIGRQGAVHISANEIARHVDSIGYDIVCGISARVPRNYVRSAH